MSAGILSLIAKASLRIEDRRVREMRAFRETCGVLLRWKAGENSHVNRAAGSSGDRAAAGLGVTSRRRQLLPMFRLRPPRLRPQPHLPLRLRPRLQPRGSLRVWPKTRRLRLALALLR